MREVMTDAWRMFRITGESFAACLKACVATCKTCKGNENKGCSILLCKGFNR